MAVLNCFAPPANLVDLTAAAQTALERQWSESVNRWTETAILGNPWGALNDRDRNSYFNPLVTDSGPLPISKAIAWTAFPNRILVNFANVPFFTQMGYAEGVHDDGTFGPPPNVNGKPYGPGGPRGWQDEYCEWIATRDSTGAIARIDFTCENPEYWFSLWRLDPDRVLELYQQLVGPSVQIADLVLKDGNGQPVIDRATGKPVYDPINMWNTQPSGGSQPGAVHLISPPNTLNAEIYLAAAATLLRGTTAQPITDPTKLIQCSQYGTPGRNSDPHIGAEVNNVIITGGLFGSLQDPVGLYIQTPDFSGYSLPVDPNLPAGAKASDCWTVLRGHTRGVGDNIDFILHARFEIPQSWKIADVAFGVGDIQINGNKIKYGAQLTQTFQIALRAQAAQTTRPDEPFQPCPTDNPTAVPWPQVVQDLNLLLAGSTSSAVTMVEQGSQVANIAVLALNTTQTTKVSFTGPADLHLTVTHFEDVPSFGGQLFVLSIQADAAAALGDRGLQLTADDGTAGPAAPGMLRIVPPGSLDASPPGSLISGLETAPADRDVAQLALLAANLGAVTSGYAAKLSAAQRSMKAR